MTIQNSVFKDFNADVKGGFMFSESKNLELTLTNNTFECRTSAYTYSADLQANMESNAPYKTRSGAFYIDDGALIKSKNTTV